MSEIGNTQTDVLPPLPPPLIRASVNVERRGLRFGDLLGTSFGLLFSRFFIIPLALVVMLPTLLWSICLPMVRTGLGVGASNVQLNMLLTILNMLVFVLCQSVLSAVLIYAVVKKLQGQHVSFGAAVTRGLGASLRSFATGLLTGLITTAGYALMVLLRGSVTITLSGFWFLNWFLSIPGVIWWTIMCLAIPVTVVERVGPFASLWKSARLTKDYRWKIFGAFFVVWFLQWIVSVMLITAIAAITSSSHAVVDIVRNISIARYFVGSLQAALTAVMVSYGYYRLVEAKEGTNIDKIASVFE
jgi:hypothetical protein